MALALKYTATALAYDGSTDRVELWEEGFVGSSTAIRLVEVVEVGGDESNTDLLAPIKHTAREVTLAPIDEATGLEDDTIRDDLKDLIRLGEDRDVQVIHKVGGSDAWTGWLVPTASTFLLDDSHAPMTFFATDRLGALADYDYLDPATGGFYTDQVDIIVAIAEILSDFTGLSLSIQETTRWRPSGQALTRPLEGQVKRRGFMAPGSDGRGAKGFKVGTVLESLLRAYGGQLMQDDGYWRLSNPTRFNSGATTRQLEYDSAGAYAASTSLTTSLDLDASEVRFDPETQEGDALEPIKRAEATYAMGNVVIADIENASFEYWDGAAPTTQAVGWTYTGASTSYHRAGPGAASDNLAIDEAIVAEGASNNSYAIACAIFAEQDVGNFIGGTTGIEFVIGWHVAPGPDAFTRAEYARGYWRAKFVINGNTYWWNKGTGWVLSAGVAARRIRMDGVLDEFGIATNDLSLFRMEERNTLDALPETGVGVLTLSLGQLVRERIGGASIGADQQAVYEDVAIHFEDDPNQLALTYAVEDATVENGELVEVTLLVGDGPVASAPRLLYEDDGTTLAAAWQRVSGATTAVHTELIAREYMITGRQKRRRVRFTAYDLDHNDVTLFQAFTFDGDRYWPVYLRRERMRGLTELVGIELRDDGMDSLTTTSETGGGDVFVGGSEIGRTVVTLLGDTDAFNAQRAVTVTTATISSGAQTSATINPVQASVFKDDTEFAIVDLVTNAVYSLTANGNYDGGTTLNFDSYSFPNNVKSGSYVVADPLDGLTRLVIADAGLSVVVAARELGTVNETLAPGAQRGPGAGDLVIDGLNFDTFDNQAIKIVDNGPGGTGDVYAATLDLADVATTTNLSFDDGAGGDVTFTNGLQVGGTIQYTEEKDLVPTSLNVFFNGIEVEAKIFKTSSWDGTADANGNITSPGTQGWALTGVAGQPSDADITGSVNIGGGNARADKTNGLLIKTQSTPSIPGSLSFHTDITSPSTGNRSGYVEADTSGTPDVMRVAADNGLDLWLQTVDPAASSGDVWIRSNNAAINVQSAFNEVTQGTSILLNTSGVHLQLNDSTQYIKITETNPSASVAAGFGHLYIKTTDHKLYFKDQDENEYDLTSGGGGDVTGPGSSTDKAIVIFSGTTGKVIQNQSGITINSNTMLFGSDVASFGASNELVIKYDGASTACRLDFLQDLILREATGPAQTYLVCDVSANAVELYKDNARVCVTSTLGLTVDSGNQLVLDGDGTGSALVLGADQDAALYFDGSDTIFDQEFDGGVLKFLLDNGGGSSINMLQLDPDGPYVAFRTPQAAPASNTTNFPEIGTVILYRSAGGAGSDLIAKCRTATSTYETINLGTFA